MRVALLRAAIAFTAAAASGLAHAHPGHEAGAMAGLLHPLLGLDHLLAMLAVGMWASQAGGRGRGLLPASFIAVMGIAAAAAVMGLALPVFEFGVAGSLLMAGLLLAFRIQVAPLAGAAIVSLFALFHGYAHGAELPAGASAWTYFAGFLLTSGGLLYLGRKVGAQLVHRKNALTAAGAVLAAAGAWMVSALV